MIETWLRLHVLEAVQARLQQPAAEFSTLDILLDVQLMTGVRLSASEYDIAIILKAVPGIKQVARSDGRMWSKGSSLLVSGAPCRTAAR